jgi:putative intracellular protease/amidase
MRRRGADALLLPGGHAKPIRQYLESARLHAHLASFFPLTARAAPAPGRKVVGAICHGVLALAFARGDGGESVLAGVESTTLPRWMEGAAWGCSQLWALGDYYRTYGPEGRWCADDVPRAGATYVCGPLSQTCVSRGLAMGACSRRPRQAVRAHGPRAQVCLRALPGRRRDVRAHARRGDPRGGRVGVRRGVRRGRARISHSKRRSAYMCAGGAGESASCTIVVNLLQMANTIIATAPADDVGRA